LIRRRFLLVGVLLALFALGWWAGRGGASGDLYANIDLFVEVLHKVEQSYVEPVEPRQLVEGALRGMLRDLDPHSQYLDARAYENLQATTQGSFGGIGVVVSIRDHHPTVISPIEGSPAWNLGIRPGDVITRIDGAASASLTVEEVASRLRGPEGTHVQITVEREGEEAPREYSIEREVIVTKSVPYAFMLENHVGYLRLANFSENSGAEVKAAMERLRASGATRVLLDLRSNPGGLLDQAVDVVEQLVRSGTLVVQTRGRARGQTNRYYSAEQRPQLDWPVVVLVDGGSASAAEIVAGALQDLDRALIVGETSFGKGTVQSLYPLKGRSVALKLTTAKYYTPSGRSIHSEARNARLLQADDEEDDEALDDEEPAAPAAPADTARPAFRTAAGRTVYGGGGIAPDLIARPDSLPPLTRRVESRGLTFKFANRWVKAHPGWKVDSRIDDAVRRDLVSFLQAEKVAFTADELAAERPVLEGAIRRELARRVGGDGAAARVALQTDPVVERALDVLSRTRTPREVFAAAAAPVPGRLAEHPAPSR